MIYYKILPINYDFTNSIKFYHFILPKLVFLNCDSFFLNCSITGKGEIQIRFYRRNSNKIYPVGNKRITVVAPTDVLRYMYNVSRIFVQLQRFLAGCSCKSTSWRGNCGYRKLVDAYVVVSQTMEQWE